VKLIVGLGNPGRSYSKHRHNVGFRVVDLLGERHGISIDKRSFGALVGTGSIHGQEVLLAKPQTFMNLSGDAVAPLVGYYKLEPEHLIVVHDDIDLDLGVLKIVKGAGDGGHNGVRSIIGALGSKEFYRVRVGIGRSPPGVDPADYVLAPFDERGEAGDAASSIERAGEAVETLIKEGLSEAQQRYH
jgi:PTH1 family peptidyl-tRNA hydrolase